MTPDFLGKGTRFPFEFQRRSGGVRISTATSSDHEHIRESILQILNTRPGERFMRPDFGSRVRDLVFEPNISVLKGLLRHYVIDAIRRWEKRVVMTSIEFVEDDGDRDSNVIRVRISYRLVNSPVEGSLVYPFYRGGDDARI